MRALLRPVLFGTTSVQESEWVLDVLVRGTPGIEFEEKKAAIQVLNARPEKVRGSCGEGAGNVERRCGKVREVRYADAGGLGCVMEGLKEGAWTVCGKFGEAEIQVW